MVKHGKKDNSTMPTHPQDFQPLTWQEYVACQHREQFDPTEKLERLKWSI